MPDVCSRREGEADGDFLLRGRWCHVFCVVIVLKGLAFFPFPGMVRWKQIFLALIDASGADRPEDCMESAKGDLWDKKKRNRPSKTMAL